VLAVDQRGRLTSSAAVGPVFGLPPAAAPRAAGSVEDGKLRFARLERAIDLAPQALATFARSETLRLAQYLTTLRALPRDGGPVTVLVVAPQGQRAAFAQALSSDSRLVFTTVDAEDAVRKSVSIRVDEALTLNVVDLEANDVADLVAKTLD